VGSSGAADDPAALPSYEAEPGDVASGQAGSSAEGEGKAAQVIVVTGSRIQRPSFDAPTPVRVFEREDIQASGAANMADLVRRLPMNSGSEGQFGLGNGTVGGSQFNLRGLGLNTTLILLNGRRLVTYPEVATDGSNYTDVNQIPLEFVERIEIATGGASGIYGSDAVAGVVNIITRQRFDGASVAVRGQTTDTWDQQEGEVAGIIGTSNDKGSVIAQISYYRRWPLAATDRDFTDGTNVSTIGNPGTFISVPNLSFQTDPACGRKGTDSMVVGDPAKGTNRCAFDFNSDWNLVNREERILAYTTMEYDLSEHVTAFGEVGFANNTMVASASPAYPAVQRVIVPANHPDNVIVDPMTGAPSSSIFLGRVMSRADGPARNDYELRGFRAVAGLRGDLSNLARKAPFRSWRWDLSTTWHENEHKTLVVDALIDNLQRALNSCADPADKTPCFNPFYSSEDGTGTRNTRAAMDFINGELKRDARSGLTTAEANFAGDMFELPGGQAGFALGAQFRQERNSVDMDDSANARRYLFLVGGDDWKARRNVLSGYGELGLPVAKALEIQAAVRTEKYEEVDTTTNPKLGVSWAPLRTFGGPDYLTGLRLRSTFATAFRAPSLIQQYGSQTSLEQFLDPGPAFSNNETRGNPNLKSESAIAIDAGVEYIYKGLQLDMEYWQYDYDDIIIRQDGPALLTACRASQAIQEMDPSAPLDPACEQVNFDPTSGEFQGVRTTYTNASQVQTAGIDFSANYSLPLGGSGILSMGAAGSFTFHYRIPRSFVPDIPLADGTVRDAPDCDKRECDVAGKRNITNFARSLPRLRMGFPASYALGDHSVGARLNFVSGYANDDPNSATKAGKFAQIDSWTTLDLSYAYTLGNVIGKATHVRAGVNNLLDADPPKVENTSFGYDIFTHDPRGRLLYIRVGQDF
jgi:outer membrane receptor protein involved in Fe transport